MAAVVASTVLLTAAGPAAAQDSTTDPWSAQRTPQSWTAPQDPATGTWSGWGTWAMAAFPRERTGSSGVAPGTPFPAGSAYQQPLPDRLPAGAEPPVEVAQTYQRNPQESCFLWLEKDGKYRAYALQVHDGRWLLTVSEGPSGGLRIDHSKDYYLTAKTRHSWLAPRELSDGPFTFILPAPWDGFSLKATIRDSRPGVNVQHTAPCYPG